MIKFKLFQCVNFSIKKKSKYQVALFITTPKPWLPVLGSNHAYETEISFDFICHLLNFIDGQKAGERAKKVSSSNGEVSWDSNTSDIFVPSQTESTDIFLV